MVLIIDNYDSFTYNIYQAISTMTDRVRVVRNDRVTVEELLVMEISHLVISPGPGRPDGAGISLEAVRSFTGRLPILGVCLGHKTIGQVFGAKVVHADRIMHGKTSSIFHDGQSIYYGIPNPFEAIRYHSLIVDRDSFPDCLEISAWTEDGEIMGLRHRKYKIEGVQFHPESILTDAGGHIIRNFIHNNKGRN